MRRWVASLLWFAALPGFPHEIGTTRATVDWPAGGGYSLTIATDAAPLLEKLAASAGRTGELAAFDEVFRKRLEFAFDRTAVRPAIAYRVEDDGGATIVLTGPVPAGAKSFTFRYGWTFTSYALAVRDGETIWLDGGETSPALPVGKPAQLANRWRTAGRYLALGFTHILPLGLDHVLFVLGIYLLNSRARPILLQVTAFTAAHSITLGLSMYGVLEAPPRLVEPLIAVSIAYVAIENLFLSEVRPWRIALVFAFGLLHGMGFAGVLTDIGLPRNEFVLALLTFNLGVEAGQLAVIGLAALLLGRQWSRKEWYRARIAAPASILIACVAVYWTIQRLAAGA